MSTISSTSSNVLSWTSQDPRSSYLFSQWGVLYRFSTEVDVRGQATTSLYRTVRKDREDRVARLEWGPNGTFGRAIIGKQQMAMADLVRPDPYNVARVFSGPDGQSYRWRSSPSGDANLYDANGNMIAFWRPTRPRRSTVGDVYGELHFVESAGSGTVMHPPFMDAVCVTAMLYRLVTLYNIA